jgi:hypothetical protein
MAGNVAAWAERRSLIGSTSEGQAALGQVVCSLSQTLSLPR